MTGGSFGCKWWALPFRGQNKSDCNLSPNLLERLLIGLVGMCENVSQKVTW